MHVLGTNFWYQILEHASPPIKPTEVYHQRHLANLSGIIQTHIDTWIQFNRPVFFSVVQVFVFSKLWQVTPHSPEMEFHYENMSSTHFNPLP